MIFTTHKRTTHKIIPKIKYSQEIYEDVKRISHWRHDKKLWYFS